MTKATFMDSLSMAELAELEAELGRGFDELNMSESMIALSVAASRRLGAPLTFEEAERLSMKQAQAVIDAAASAPAPAPAPAVAELLARVRAIQGKSPDPGSETSEPSPAPTTGPQPTTGQ